MAFHRYHEDELAAERARGYSLERLLSKDGAITRVAELAPCKGKRRAFRLGWDPALKGSKGTLKREKLQFGGVRLFLKLS